MRCVSDRLHPVAMEGTFHELPRSPLLRSWYAMSRNGNLPRGARILCRNAAGPPRRDENDRDRRDLKEIPATGEGTDVFRTTRALISSLRPVPRWPRRTSAA